MLTLIFNHMMHCFQVINKINKMKSKTKILKQNILIKMKKEIQEYQCMKNIKEANLTKRKSTVDLIA